MKRILFFFFCYTFNYCTSNKFRYKLFVYYLYASRRFVRFFLFLFLTLSLSKKRKKDIKSQTQLQISTFINLRILLATFVFHLVYFSVRVIDAYFMKVTRRLARQKNYNIILFFWLHTYISRDYFLKKFRNFEFSIRRLLNL